MQATGMMDICGRRTYSPAGQRTHRPRRSRPPHLARNVRNGRPIGSGLPDMGPLRRALRPSPPVAGMLVYPQVCACDSSLAAYAVYGTIGYFAPCSGSGFQSALGSSGAANSIGSGRFWPARAAPSLLHRCFKSVRT
jgi:hypothetical protein